MTQIQIHLHTSHIKPKRMKNQFNFSSSICFSAVIFLSIRHFIQRLNVDSCMFVIRSIWQQCLCGHNGNMYHNRLTSIRSQMEWKNPTLFRPAALVIRRLFRVSIAIISAYVGRLCENVCISFECIHRKLISTTSNELWKYFKYFSVIRCTIIPLTLLAYLRQFFSFTQRNDDTNKTNDAKPKTKWWKNLFFNLNFHLAKFTHTKTGL